jgi:hypothetical protein
MRWQLSVVLFPIINSVVVLKDGDKSVYPGLRRANDGVSSLHETPIAHVCCRVKHLCSGYGVCMYLDLYLLHSGRASVNEWPIVKNVLLSRPTFGEVRSQGSILHPNKSPP